MTNHAIGRDDADAAARRTNNAQATNSSRRRLITAEVSDTPLTMSAPSQATGGRMQVRSSLHREIRGEGARARTDQNASAVTARREAVVRSPTEGDGG